MSLAAPPWLLLWDIDGTLLLRAADAHRDALLHAIAEVHGVRIAAEAKVETAGRTDRWIARRLLLDHGVEARVIDERMDALREVASQVYARADHDLAGSVAPGIAELLRELAARDDVLQALLTGNFEAIARHKLRCAGIGEWFAPGQGAYGSDDESRAALPPIARRRAAPTGSAPHPRDRTIVIGDTPHDIACARADDVAVIAVTTGPFPAAQLAEADVVARNTAELRAALLSPDAGAILTR